MKCERCHTPIVPDFPGLNAKVLEISEDEQFIVHERCAERMVEELNRAKTTTERNEIYAKILKALSMVIVIEFLTIFAMKADEILDQKDWKKGAAVTFIKADGGCVFKPFLKVGTSDDWEGVPQVLGVTPGEVQFDKDGNVILERIGEAVFIPLGHAKNIRGRICRCPPYIF
jgi:hypothetical protein